MAKKIAAVVLAIAMLFMFASCNMATVNTERDNAQVIIEVGDTVVTKGEIINNYNSYLNVYSQLYGTDKESFKTSFKDVYEDLVNDLIEKKTEETLVNIYAEKMGVSVALTDEQVKDIEDELKSTYDSYKKNFTDKVNADEDVPENEKAAEIDRLLNNALDEIGYNDGSMKAEKEYQYKLENLKKWLDKDYEATEDLLKEFYEKKLSEQKGVLDETPGSISTYEGSGEVSLYVPEGLRYVKVLYVALSAEDQATVSEAGDDGKDAAVDNALKNIKADADKALAEAEKDFDKAVETYGDDATKNAGDEGVRTYEKDTTYPEDVVKAAFKLAKKGDISELIATDKGYYIVQYVDDMTPGAKALSEVHDELMEKMISDHMEDTYTTALAQWKDETVIKSYPERLG